MQEGSDFDVIVVGAGPGGSTAARILSGAGYRVLVLDSKTFPRPKLCGGLLTEKTLRSLDRVFGPRPRQMLDSGEIGIAARHYELRYRRRLLIRSECQVPFRFVDRARYDAFLLGEAKAAGATVIEGCPAIGVDVDRLEVQTEGRTYRARGIVGADGANSVVRRAVLARQGVPARKWSEGIGTGLEVFVPRQSDAAASDCAVVLFGYVNAGYAWVFPAPNGWAVGLGGLNRRNRGTFRELVSRFVSASGVVADDSPRARGHPVPVWNPGLVPAHGNVLLVGDAGRFVDPLTGEGIYSAQRTAELASCAIADALTEGVDAAGGYVARLESHVVPTLRSSLSLRRWVFFAADTGLWLPLRWFLRRYGSRLMRHIQLAGESEPDAATTCMKLRPTAR